MYHYYSKYRMSANKYDLLYPLESLPKYIWYLVIRWQLSRENIYCENLYWFTLCWGSSFIFMIPWNDLKMLNWNNITYILQSNAILCRSLTMQWLVWVELSTNVFSANPQALTIFGWGSLQNKTQIVYNSKIELNNLYLFAKSLNWKLLSLYLGPSSSSSISSSSFSEKGYMCFLNMINCPENV